MVSPGGKFLRTLRIFLQRNKYINKVHVLHKNANLVPYPSNISVKIHTKPSYRKEILMAVFTVQFLSVLHMATEPTFCPSQMRHPWLLFVEHPL